MTKEPERLTASALQDLFTQIESAASERFMSQMLAQLSRETYVGGRRVTRQELPPLPASAAAPFTG